MKSILGDRIGSLGSPRDDTKRIVQHHQDQWMSFQTTPWLWLRPPRSEIAIAFKKNVGCEHKDQTPPNWAADTLANRWPIDHQNDYKHTDPNRWS